MNKRERKYHYGSKGLFGLLRCKGVYQPTGSSTITVEDIREWKRQLDEAGIISRRTSPIEISDYSDTHYRLSGGAFGLVRKETWNKLLMESLNQIK